MYSVDMAGFGRSREDMPYPMAEYQGRLLNLRNRMKKNNIDILLVRKPEDLRYLTNFYTIGDSDNQTLIIDASSEPVFHCRLLEARLIEKLTWVSEWYSQLDADDSLHTLKTILQQKFNYSGKIVKIDHSAVSASDLKKLETSLGCTISDADDLLEKMRLVRTDAEIEKIKAVSKITEAGILAGKAAIKIGELESSIFMQSLNAMIARGSEEPAYSPIIRTDEPAGHGSWEVGKRVKKGLVFLEMSANIHGHHAPMMRTCYILESKNDSVPDWVMESENLINKAFEKCLPLMKPGTKASEIDSIARKIICSNSFGGTMVARAGYTAGGTATVPGGYAGWGDACFSFAGNNDSELQENQTFHFIPWIQKIDGKETGPIGLSDTLVVTADGGKRMGQLALKIDILGPDGTVLNN
ncbi:MAG: Xaa-Pro peptidase family protein [Desulfotignum sp.]|nr:Xaa-Pro peptidase family protein [Desulfotignum sp.]MCF8124940.1 Xaa-Pro peptidase family protein [Desulfotignum sp.]